MDGRTPDRGRGRKSHAGQVALVSSPSASPPRTGLEDLPELDDIVLRLQIEGGFGLAQIAHLLGVERWVVGRSLLRAMQRERSYPQPALLVLDSRHETGPSRPGGPQGCSLVGRRLSRYDIRELIGCGGMGVVYRAFDRVSRREVALKVLPGERATDLRWRLKFRQEARTAASLEHPHICMIHELDEAEGLLFMTMELIRGECLQDRLRHWNPARRRYELTPLPLSQAVDLGIEIGLALGRAHEQGIVHLDLKPANVMITESGHAKLIDFGLARMLEAGPCADADGESSHARQTGRVCGTLCYMSPEQAAGLPVDQRSDIFTFGVLLHEMLTGANPLRSGSRPGRRTGRPSITSPPPEVVGESAVTSGLQYVLDRCLARASSDRYPAIGDLLTDLQEVRTWVGSLGDESSPCLPVRVDQGVVRWPAGPSVGCLRSGPTRPWAVCPPLSLAERALDV